MKIVILILSIVLTGCSSTYSKKDQLMLVVPQELLTPPSELQEL